MRSLRFQKIKFAEKKKYLYMATEWPLILGNHLENSWFLFPKVREECGLHHIIITLLQGPGNLKALLGSFPVITSTFLTAVFVLILNPELHFFILSAMEEKSHGKILIAGRIEHWDSRTLETGEAQAPMPSYLLALLLGANFFTSLSLNFVVRKIGWH